MDNLVVVVEIFWFNKVDYGVDDKWIVMMCQFVVMCFYCYLVCVEVSVSGQCRVLFGFEVEVVFFGDMVEFCVYCVCFVEYCQFYVKFFQFFFAVIDILENQFVWCVMMDCFDLGGDVCQYIVLSWDVEFVDYVIDGI